MPVPQILIIADDLTGAADTGAAFARAGWLTLVALDAAAQIPQSDVLVVSTESRDLAQDVAVTRVRGVLPNLQKSGQIPHVYKKIDSTLRGHPGTELAALMDRLRLEQALVAPAFPAQGRATIGGRQLVDGVPLERTSFGRDVPSSNLLAVFDIAQGENPARLIELDTVRRGPDAICEALDAFRWSLLVADAETDADLAAIAEAGLKCGVRLWCGSAGLARALSNVLPPPRYKATAPAIPPRPDGAVLVVAGSRHRRTTHQVEVAQGWGAAVIRLDSETLRGDEAAVGRTIKQVSRRLADDEHVILTTADLDVSTPGGRPVAECLARITRALAAQGLVGGLVLTGGQAAVAVCSALEASSLWLRGETQPGIAWGVLLDGLVPGLPVVTKAGGFGQDEALAAAIRKLVDWKVGRMEE